MKLKSALTIAALGTAAYSIARYVSRNHCRKASSPDRNDYMHWTDDEYADRLGKLVKEYKSVSPHAFPDETYVQI